MNAKPTSVVVGAVVAMSLVANAVMARPAEAGKPRQKFKGPLKVFVLAGQSNMQGHGKISTFEHTGMDQATKPMLAEMLNADGSSKACERVRISSIGCEEAEQTGKLAAGFGATTEKIGPEFTFALGVQKFTDARPFWRDASVSPSNFDYHWNRNGEMHYLMGKRMGQGMTSVLPSP